MTEAIRIGKYQYIPTQMSEPPPGYRFDVPREYAGQIVELAFGTRGRGEGGPGDEWMRQTDASDKRVTYFHLAFDLPATGDDVRLPRGAADDDE